MIYNVNVLNVCPVRSRSHVEAVKWYEKAISTSSGEEEESGGTFDATMDNPTYQLQAKVAELYLAGEYGLNKDPNYAGQSFFLFNFILEFCPFLCSLLFWSYLFG